SGARFPTPARSASMASSLLSSFFGPSPVRPLKARIAKAAAAARELLGSIDAALAGARERAATIRKGIEALEHDADTLAAGLLARRSVDAVIQAEKSVGELEDLFTVGFRGNEVTLVERMITELDAIEDETDQIASELRSGVFAIEDSLPPVSVVFLYKAIEWMGALGVQSPRAGRE